MPVSFADGRSPSAGRRLTSPPTMALMAAKELLTLPKGEGSENPAGD